MIRLPWVILFLLTTACSRSGTLLNLLTEIPPRDTDGAVHVVIEIAAGSLEKWEVNKQSGQLVPDSLNGQPRKVNYLPYPANYGMIPQTLLPKNAGGDGDPLDVILLGAAVPRGELVKARVIGVLKLLDGGEQDDKLIAVPVGRSSSWEKLRSLEELQEAYPGVTQIIELWFTHYKGKGKMKSLGYQEAAFGQQILEAAIKAYQEK